MEEMESAINNVVYVGHAVANYMEHCSPTPQDCEALFSSYLEMLDGYLNHIYIYLRNKQ